MIRSARKSTKPNRQLNQQVTSGPTPSRPGGGALPGASFRVDAPACTSGRGPRNECPRSQFRHPLAPSGQTRRTRVLGDEAQPSKAKLAHRLGRVAVAEHVNLALSQIVIDNIWRVKRPTSRHPAQSNPVGQRRSARSSTASPSRELTPPRCTRHGRPCRADAMC